MLNHIVLMGRLTRDPELRRTQSGTPVTSFTLAVDRDFKGQNGERETDFIDCVAWQSSAEFVKQYFFKGRVAVVTGRLQSRKWQDRDGNNRTSWEISADNVYFGESRRRDEDSRDSYSPSNYGGNSYDNNRSASAPAPSAFAELGAYWTELLSSFQVDSGDARVDRMAGLWNQYQCMVTFNMSRSASYYESGIGRGMGFRDSTQDLLGFVHLIPARARERILDIAATQFPDGSAYHQYQPLTKRGNNDIGSGFNDDPLWLIFGVAAYVKETGDLSILSEMVPFDNNDALAQPLMEHLRRSIHYTLEHLGPHGLPLIGRADWNDCLNLNCFSNTPGESFQTTENNESGAAESTFIAGMFTGVCPDYEALCRLYGWNEEADQVSGWYADMEKAILTYGWDGEWFVRAYDANGNKVGSHECDEGKIYIEPQGFVVMSGVGVKEGYAQKAMDSVEKHLLSEHGVAILTPPYTVYHVELGEISSYPPGYKENGGIFCHNNPWIALAQARLGHGGKAFDIYRRTCPAWIEDQELHYTEPYVYSQMVAGPYAPHFGQAKNSWLTGTAAWSFYTISQGILGVKPDYDGLVIDPCLPDELEEYTVTRRFRGCRYRIHVWKTGQRSMTVDGAALEGNRIPLTDKLDVAVDVTV